MPHWFWRHVVNPERIWEYEPTATRKIAGGVYLKAAPFLFACNPFRDALPRRLLDKTASNSLRMELLGEMFPDAKFVHVQRHGMAAIESMLKAWLYPRRFVTFHVPEKLEIEGYEGAAWNFMLPEGWRSYTQKHLTDVCAWQWEMCQKRILDFKHHSPQRVLSVKTETLATNPATELARLAKFLDLPLVRFAPFLQGSLPEINTTPSKGAFPFPDHFDRILKKIEPTLDTMGYA